MSTVNELRDKLLAQTGKTQVADATATNPTVSTEGQNTNVTANDPSGQTNVGREGAAPVKVETTSKDTTNVANAQAATQTAQGSESSAGEGSKSTEDEKPEVNTGDLFKGFSLDDDTTTSGTETNDFSLDEKALKAISKIAGKEFKSSDELAQIFKANDNTAKAQPSIKIPGIPDEVVPLIAEGVITLKEAADLTLIADVTHMSNDEVVLEHLVKELSFTPEEAQEELDSMSELEKRKIAIPYKREMQAKREQAIQALKVAKEAQALQVQKQVEEATQKVQAMTEALKSDLKSIETLKFGEHEFSPETLKTVKRAMLDPAELRKLMYGTKGTISDKGDLERAMTVLALSLEGREVLANAQAAGKHEARKALINEAANFNPNRGVNTGFAGSAGSTEVKSGTEKLREALNAERQKRG